MTTKLARHFIFIGVPGAGKGTFSKIFCDKLGWQHVSLGDVMREEVKKKSIVGKEVEGYMSSGKLVPDNLAVSLALDTIDKIVLKSPKSTIILDGFPRTVQQAESIADKYPNFFAINIMLKRSVAIEKLAGRVTCSKCKKDWNVSNIIYDGYRMPSLLPTKEKCPNKLTDCDKYFEKRADDTPDIIGRRFDEFNQKTAPLIDFYRKKNMLREFDVKRGVDDADDLLKLMLS